MAIINGLVAQVREFDHTCRTADDALRILGGWNWRENGQYLIIFDNVDDCSVSIATYFPHSEHASILISTRYHTLGSLAPQAHLELGEMSSKEAVEAILKVVVPPDQGATNEQAAIALSIADELGYFPVALIQAGGYIKQRRCLGGYLDRFTRRHQYLLTYPLPEQRDSYKTTLYASLDLTSQVLTPRAQQYLYIFSFSHHRNFPLTLIGLAAKDHFLFEPVELLERDDQFRHAVNLLHEIFCPTGEWIEDDFYDVVFDLQRDSLLTLSEDSDRNRMLSMHKLVRTWARDRLPEGEDVAYRNAMARLLSCGSGHEGSQLHEHLIPHIRALSANWDDLRVNDRASFADLFAARGIAEESVQLWQGVHRATTQSEEEASLQTLNVIRRWKAAYYAQGDEKRAMGMSQEIGKLERALKRTDQRGLMSGFERVQSPRKISRKNYLTAQHVDNRPLRTDSTLR